MSFDMEQAAKDMLAAIEGELSTEWPKIRDCTEKAVREEQDILKAIAKARIEGAIDDDEMQSQLDDEKETLEAVLLVCKIKARRAAQDAANAAIEVLKKAIRVSVFGS